LTVLNH